MTAPAVRSPRRAWVALTLASAVLLAGCSAAASPNASAPAAQPGDATPSPSAVTGRPSDLPIPTPPLATVPPSAKPVVGEVPAGILAAARADLAGRVAAADAAAADVVRAEAVQWPDGSLGCRVPGESYLQVITPGYWIVLAVDGTEYDYRATEDGAIRLCDHALKPNPGG